MSTAPKVLVLGGAGFIGRHAAAALAARGYSVVIGTRRPRRAAGRLPAQLRNCERREVHMDWLTAPAAWHGILKGVDAVVNAVGILRERGFETYARVHYRGPAALAAACAARGIRLVHVSALGLHEHAASRFLRSKFWGERALMASAADYVIVRPSLLDGEGGFGAGWLRRVARWPVHFVPADSKGRIGALDVEDLGEAIARLADPTTRPPWREVELGGSASRTMVEHLAALRAVHEERPALLVKVPAWLARLASHACDLAHFSPFSFGHLELLRRDNVPAENRLPMLLGRAPKAVGRRPAPSYGITIPPRIPLVGPGL